MVQMYTRHACCVWQVVEDVLALNGIARHLKAGRASNGALRLDNTKLYFKMDDNGNPVSAAPYGECLAHQLTHVSFTLQEACTVWSSFLCGHSPISGLSQVHRIWRNHACAYCAWIHFVCVLVTHAWQVGCVSLQDGMLATACMLCG